MYHPKYYEKIDEQDMMQDAAREGFHPIKIINNPGDVYPLHQHSETKLLLFLQGSMDVEVGNQRFPCSAGDKLIIPGNTPHKAVVSSEGCMFLWAEK